VTTEDSHVGGEAASFLLGAMRAFQGGEASAFDTVYGGLWGPVSRRALKMGLGEDEAGEIAQKVLVRVYLHAGSARFPDTKRLWAWVYTITAREVYKHWAKKRPALLREEAIAALEAQPAGSEEDPSRRAAGAEEKAAVGDCLSRLPADERLPVVGTILQGLPFRAAAELHGLTLGQFKHRYEKAIQKLRDCLRGKGIESA